MAKKQQTFTFQRRAYTHEALDKLRAREPFPPPSRGEMINLLIERALAALDEAKPHTKPRESANGDRAAGLATSEPRQLPRAPSKSAADKIEEGLQEALQIARGEAKPAKVRPAAKVCPDCGLNFGLVGEAVHKRNCPGRKTTPRRDTAAALKKITEWGDE